MRLGNRKAANNGGLSVLKINGGSLNQLVRIHRETAGFEFLEEIKVPAVFVIIRDAGEVLHFKGKFEVLSREVNENHFFGAEFSEQETAQENHLRLGAQFDVLGELKAQGAYFIIGQDHDRESGVLVFIKTLDQFFRGVLVLSIENSGGKT